LSYEEDSSAEVDANVVAADDGRIVELQMTAEREPLTDEQFSQLLTLGKEKIREIIGKMKLELRGKRV
jgi:ribonuclease PH